MPVPRQGRKGGKVTTAATAEPAVAVEAPNSVSPEPPKEKEVAEETTATKRSAWSDGALQFDKDAVQQVGRGSLVRGLKTVQTETVPPTTSLEAIQAKLKEVIQKQKTTRYNLKTVLRESMEATSKHSVAIINPNDGHLLAVQLTGESKPVKVLVVVSHYYDVSDTARILREMREARREAPQVGELVGATVQGEKKLNLWVTSSESANVFLSTKQSFSPFTHIIFPELVTMTPLVSMLLGAIRNHMQASPADSCVKVVIGTTVRYSAKLCEFFRSLTLKCLVNPSSTVEFSYDESCALAEMSLVKLIGATSQRLPEKRTRSHCIAVAGEIISRIIKDATVPQRLHIFTGDFIDVRKILSSLKLKDTTVWYQGFLEENSGVASKQEKHAIYVLNNAEFPSLTGYLPPHVVIDLGTMGQQIQLHRDESFVGGRITVWTTQEELEEHLSLVCPGGGYFRVFPDLSDARDPSSGSYSVYEVESALLQSARTNLTNDESQFFSVPQEVKENIIHNLSDNCLTVSPSQLTFTGEMASRLPLGTDLVTFLINSCAMGLAEPAIVVASICVLSMRRYAGNSEPPEAWSNAVLDSRKQFAAAVVEESDLLADAVTYLEWHRRAVSGDPSATTTFPSLIGTPLSRLQHIQKLIAHLTVQLSDYVFLKNLTDAAVVEEVQRKIVSKAPLICLTYAVSSSRRALTVRDAGSTTKERNATLCYVRTAKKVFPSSTPSAVVWESLSTLIAADIRTDEAGGRFEGSRFTYLKTGFYNAALLLLYPSIVYSAPQYEPGNDTTVFFGMSCNNHRKRYRVAVSHATMILNFREKWNLALGYLHALRMFPRPISRQKFFHALRERSRCFDLLEFYDELQRELMQLVLEIDVFEHHGSFDLLQPHYLMPHILFPSLRTDTEASDCVIAKEFESKNPWPTTVARETPKTDIGASIGKDFPAMVEEADDIEDFADLYFLHRSLETPRLMQKNNPPNKIEELNNNVRWIDSNGFQVR